MKETLKQQLATAEVEAQRAIESGPVEILEECTGALAQAPFEDVPAVDAHADVDNVGTYLEDLYGDIDIDGR